MSRRFGYPIVIVLLFMWLATSHTRAQQGEAPEREGPDVEQRLGELLESRRDTLGRYSEVMLSRFEDGSQPFEPVIRARDAYFLAELELAKSKQQRLEICKKRIENFRSLEESATIRTSVGAAKTEEKLLATAARLQPEIECLREELKPD